MALTTTAVNVADLATPANVSTWPNGTTFTVDTDGSLRIYNTTGQAIMVFAPGHWAYAYLVQS